MLTASVVQRRNWNKEQGNQIAAIAKYTRHTYRSCFERKTITITITMTMAMIDDVPLRNESSLSFKKYSIVYFSANEWKINQFDAKKHGRHVYRETCISPTASLFFEVLL